MNQKSDAVKLVCAIIFAGLSVQAATPTGLSSALLTNFNKLYFSLDLSAAPSNIVKGLWLTNNADGSISPSGNADVKVPASVFAGSLLLSNLNTGQAFLIDLGDGTALLVSTNIVTVTNVTYNYSYATNYYTNVYQQFDYVTNIFTNVYQEFSYTTNIFTNVYQQFDYTTNIYTNVYQTFNNVTNYYTNVYQTFNYLTNIFTNVYQEFNYVTNIYKNSTIYYTNTTLIVNGNTNAWWNLRDDGTITPADGKNVTITNNIGAILQTPATNYVDRTIASALLVVSANIALAHGTNGVAGQEWTSVWTLQSDNAGDHTFALPTGALNPDGASFTLTNAGVVKVYFNFVGATDTAAKQTNLITQIKYVK